MIKLRTMGRSREDGLRIVFPLAIIMSTAITLAGELNNPANDSLLAMSAQHQADILGKIVWRRLQGRDSILSGHNESLTAAQR
jgi:hypothetical protein